MPGSHSLPEAPADLAFLSNPVALSALDPLKISQDIHLGRGLGTAAASARGMTAAHRRWDCLTRELDRIANERAEVLGELDVESWAGPAAEHMQTKTRQLDEYLNQLSEAALKMRNCCSSMNQAFLSTQYAVVMPQLIEENRAEAKRLSENPLTDVAAIAKIEEDYLEYTARNQEALLRYYATAMRIMQELPSLPEVSWLRAKLFQAKQQLDIISQQFSQWWNTFINTVKDFSGPIIQGFLDWWRQFFSDVSEWFSTAPAEPLSYELTEFTSF